MYGFNIANNLEGMWTLIAKLIIIGNQIISSIYFLFRILKRIIIDIWNFLWKLRFINKYLLEIIHFFSLTKNTKVPKPEFIPNITLIKWKSSTLELGNLTVEHSRELFNKVLDTLIIPNNLWGIKAVKPKTLPIENLGRQK